MDDSGPPLGTTRLQDFSWNYRAECPEVADFCYFGIITIRYPWVIYMKKCFCSPAWGGKGFYQCTIHEDSCICIWLLYHSQDRPNHVLPHRHLAPGMQLEKETAEFDKEGAWDFEIFKTWHGSPASHTDIYSSCRAKLPSESEFKLLLKLSLNSAVTQLKLSESYIPSNWYIYLVIP